jgi:hypothetical protein
MGWCVVAATAAYAILLAAGETAWTHPWPRLAAYAAGYGLSLGLGMFAVSYFHRVMRMTLSREPPTERPRWERLGRRSSDITGLIERIVFTSLMIADPETSLLGMGGWLGLKMAATWQRDISIQYPDDPVRTRDDKLFWASHAFLSLQTGFVSMAFAGAGGALTLWLLRYPPIALW